MISRNSDFKQWRPVELVELWRINREREQRQRFLVKRKLEMVNGESGREGDDRWMDGWSGHKTQAAGWGGACGGLRSGLEVSRDLEEKLLPWGGRAKREGKLGCVEGVANVWMIVEINQVPCRSSCQSRGSPRPLYSCTMGALHYFFFFYFFGFTETVRCSFSSSFRPAPCLFFSARCLDGDE